MHWVSVNDDKLHETLNKSLLLLLSLGIIKVHPDDSNNFLFGTFRLVDFNAVALPTLLTFTCTKPCSIQNQHKSKLHKNQLQCTSKCLSDL